MTQQLNQLLSFITLRKSRYLELMFRAILRRGPERAPKQSLLFYINMVRAIKKKDEALWPEPVNLAGNQMQNLVSAVVETVLEATAQRPEPALRPPIVAQRLMIGRDDLTSFPKSTGCQMPSLVSTSPEALLAGHGAHVGVPSNSGAFTLLQGFSYYLSWTGCLWSNFCRGISKALTLLVGREGIGVSSADTRVEGR